MSYYVVTVIVCTFLGGAEIDPAGRCARFVNAPDAQGEVVHYGSAAHCEARALSMYEQLTARPADLEHIVRGPWTWTYECAIEHEGIHAGRRTAHSQKGTPA